jgi:hypothetical protein
VGVVPALNPEIPDPLVLSDGGVFDNVGITSIIAGLAPPEAPNHYYLVASDAGAAISQMRKPPRGRLRKLHYMRRQLDIQGAHNNDMTSFLVLANHRGRMHTSGMAIFRIDRAVPHAGETLEQVRRLADIKTRLQRIPEGQSSALMMHAANLLWTRLTEYTDLLAPHLEMKGATKRWQSDLPTLPGVTE